jgi:putative membrane-bound dehydrogenase-like protein
MTTHKGWSRIVGLSLLATFPIGAAGDDGGFIPRKQERPPGPALLPEEAREAMSVPEGFVVELVASEPDIVNPIAMAIDERGRIWITESVEYPRREAGIGRDKIKVLEDTTGDGKADSITVFAEGLNIPCGIAIGHGGVWVSNAPDILFLRDSDGDGVADQSEVVVTGFGRHDTHELPNSLTWGPDGWLYGLNGVFNPSHVVHQGREHRFDCAVFRIHPVTREFEVFANGTSNPWGMAFDPQGSMFLSACVIDHLWHIVEGGYYQRQSGAYPAFTWHKGSIVKHRHQMAAYCGLVYFDSEAYPVEYRDVLYMGNIHGGAINADVLERQGAGYFARPREDILQANDVWFMPVSQKVGPDGNLYILDWYDRYHCYQDANRDPEGVDRAHGRLWRLRHEGVEALRGPFEDVGQASDEQLIELLGDGNVYHRETAQRLLAERGWAGVRGGSLVQQRVEAVVLDPEKPEKWRRHALYARAGMGALSEEFHLALLSDEDGGMRAWGVRLAGEMGEVGERVRVRLTEMVADASMDVLLQVAVVAPKVEGVDAMGLLVGALARGGEDLPLAQLAWQRMHPLLGGRGAEFLAAAREHELSEAGALRAILPRAFQRLLVEEAAGGDGVLGGILEALAGGGHREELALCLEALGGQVRSGELKGEKLEKIRAELGGIIGGLLEGVVAGEVLEWGRPEQASVALAVAWGDKSAVGLMRDIVGSSELGEERRLAALEALVGAGDIGLVDLIGKILERSESETAMIEGMLAVLPRVESSEVWEAIIEGWGKLGDSARGLAVEMLVQRAISGELLLGAIEAGSIDVESLNLNQVRQLIGLGEEGLAERIRAIYGLVREGRNEGREAVVEQVRKRVERQPGDAGAGRDVFLAHCAICHVLHGEGQELGPDITINGRGSFEQLLSNVLDPNLVVGEAYQVQRVTTKEGRLVAGLLAEENEQRIVLKLLGGQSEVIAADQIAEREILPVSFMPEGLESGMSEQDLADLLAYLSYDMPPDDPNARLIAGAPQPGRFDASEFELPESSQNHLVVADEVGSNIVELGQGLRGEIRDMIYDVGGGRFVRDSEWHEYGVASGAELGVVREADAIWWEAMWGQEVEVDLIVLSGTYPNQPQPGTAWKIELKDSDGWREHDRGIGGWYDSGRYGWRAPAGRFLKVSGIRVSLFSHDPHTPLRSVHFRGEAGVSWMVGRESK